MRIIRSQLAVGSKVSIARGPYRDNEDALMEVDHIHIITIILFILNWTEP